MSWQLSLSHIQIVSRLARYAILIFMAVIPALHIVLLITNDYLLVNIDNPVWNALVDHYIEQGDLWLIGILTMPFLLMRLWLMWWFTRLFTCYETGRLLDSSTVHCYLWLAWLNVLYLFLGLLIPFPLALWYMTLQDNFVLAFAIKPIDLLYPPIFLIIAYSLKLACNIQQENKEFV